MASVTRRQACRLRAHFRREGRVMRHKRVALAFKRTGKISLASPSYLTGPSIV